MSIPFVDLNAQYQSIKSEVDHAIASVFETTSFIGGEPVRKFEEDFAQYLGANHCVSCANGTDAIEIALKALGVGPGDEVIVPALTWISTAGAVNNVGAAPVFVDVLADERTIDPSLIVPKITDKTRAILPVHLYGLPARMKEIKAIAVKHKLRIIEDCAQAHGAEIDGHKVGTMGDIATFSFYPSKNLGAYGDAGAIVTNDSELAERCKKLSNHGQLVKHDHQIIGRNSGLDAIQAAVLNVKLSYLDEWTKTRGCIASQYDSLLKEVLTPLVPGGFKHVFHLYVIQSHNREALMSRLEEEEIGFGIHYPTPLPHVNCYHDKKHRKGDFPVAEKLCSEILSLPMYAELGEKEVEAIAHVIGA